MTNENFFGQDPVRHSTSVSLPQGQDHHVLFQFEPTLSNQRGALFFNNGSNILFNVNDYHRTVVVEIDFGENNNEQDISIGVIGKMSNEDLIISLAGIYIVSCPERVGRDGGKTNISGTSGQDVRIPVPVKSTNSYVTVAFHAIGHKASDDSNVFVGDPLVILVPKKTGAK